MLTEYYTARLGGTSLRTSNAFQMPVRRLHRQMAAAPSPPKKANSVVPATSRTPVGARTGLRNLREISAAWLHYWELRGRNGYWPRHRTLQKSCMCQEPYRPRFARRSRGRIGSGYSRSGVEAG